MTAIYIIIPIVIIAIVVIFWMTKRKKEGKTSELCEGVEKPTLEQLREDARATIGIKSDVWYMCKKEIKPYEEGIVYLGADINPSIKQWYKYFREATKEEIEKQHPTPPAPDPEPEPEPETDEDYTKMEEKLSECLSKFKFVLNIPDEGLTFSYIKMVVWEAYIQYFKDCSVNGIPLLVREELFPYVYNYYGTKKDENAAFMTMIGMICAWILTKICPQKSNQIFKIGYEAGGYTMQSPIYGYEFRSDPNNMRVIGAVICNAMDGIINPNYIELRNEIGGKAYDRTIQQIVDEESRYNVKDGAFYIDFRKFMCSAPGPYSPAYKDRSKNNPTFPDTKTDDGCLLVDLQIHTKVFEFYNIPDQRAVQATADKDWDEHHLYGTDVRNLDGKFDFNAVYGQSTIGKIINPESTLAKLIYYAKIAGANARGIMQHTDPSLGPVEYGRLRPGCSWEREGCKHSTTDDRLNVLTNFTIEDGDGNPTGYYDQYGNWVKPAECKSAVQYEEKQKNNLWANSYPSGHSSGETCASMIHIRKSPYMADKFLMASNIFTTSRSVARYHWNSDIIQGRVIGAMMSAVVSATKDFDKMLNDAEM